MSGCMYLRDTGGRSDTDVAPRPSAVSLSSGLGSRLGLVRTVGAW